VLWIPMLVVAPIGIMFGLDMASPGIMNRRARKITEPISNTRMFARLFIAGLFIAAMAIYLFQIGRLPTALHKSARPWRWYPSRGG
jgi:Ca2+-transporting ATPase